MTALRGLGLELVPGNHLEPHPKNPRRGDEAAIRDSIARNGWHGVLVAQRSTGRILVGNHRYREAARIFAEGWTDPATGEELVPAGSVPGLPVADRGPDRGMLLYPVHWRDVDDAAAERIMLADNRTGDLGGYDEPALLELLLASEELDGTGYSEADVDQLELALSVNPIEPWNNTPEHNLERYLATDLRQITAIFHVATFEPLVETFEAIRAREGLDTNGDVVLFLAKGDPAGADLAERIAAAESARQASTGDGDAPSGDDTPAEASEAEDAE